jgi:hypothetical protein
VQGIPFEETKEASVEEINVPGDAKAFTMEAEDEEAKAVVKDINVPVTVEISVAVEELKAPVSHVGIIEI